jgi:uncharacterized protein
MLVSFSISNFRSFAQEQTLSFVASARLGAAHETHAVAIPGSAEKVLRAGVLYGANGAGKSNLIAALQYAKRVAIGTRKESSGTGRSPFRLGNLRDKPSTFDLQFIAKDNLYRFGFSVDDERVIEEWLIHVVGNKEKPIYERSTDSDGRVEIDAPGLKDCSERLKALVTVGGRHNQSFLATVQANLEPRDFGDHLSAAIEWLDDGLTLIGPDTKPSMLGEYLASDEAFREFAGNFLKASSTGVDRLHVERTELTKDEIRALVPEAPLAKMLDEAEQQDTVAVRLPNGRELLIHREADGDHFYLAAIQAAHIHETEQEVMLELSEESDGTRRLLDLIPALYMLKQNNSAVYVIDEIDRSMHPMLVYKFVQYFLSVCTDAPCQIFVTTHESHLLNLDLLRRDEIWFAEKDGAGATNLYSLTDFNVRKDLHIEKGYFEGRFGAVPFLGDIDRLIEAQPDRAICR